MISLALLAMESDDIGGVLTKLENEMSGARIIVDKKDKSEISGW